MGADRCRWWIGAAVAGAGAGLALPPWGAAWLLWPALALLWALPRSPLGWRGGWAWGAAAVLVSHRWLLWLHPLDWVGVPLPLSLPLCLLLWGLCGLAGALLVALWLAVLMRLEGWWGGGGLAAAITAAALWGLAEVQLARGPLFWIGLGASALPGDRALAAWASLGGAGLVAALQLLIAWLLWRVLLLLVRRLWSEGIAALLSWLLAVLLLHGVGAALLRASEQAPAAQAANATQSPSALPAPAHGQRLLVVQPAIPTRQKFEAAQQQQLLQRLAAAQQLAVAAGAAGEPIDALLLPEGALPLDQPLPDPAPSEVLSGGFRRQDAEVRSSVLRFAPGDQARPSGWIDKARVVPLGEWVPLAHLWRWSGLSAVGGITPGAPSRLLERPGGAIGVAICYEIADGVGQRAAVAAGAQWLLASANLDPYPAQLQGQFQALAQLRALETGRWLVSAANTGPSLVVDSSGRLRTALPPGRPVTTVLGLEPRDAMTPYDRFGELPLLGLALAGGAWGTLGYRVVPSNGSRSTWASKASARRSSSASR
ncbi:MULTISPECIES: nitrilase-related carbon-nitrogen hydrolase [unclassified Synechococcus]|uniref:nitrilase-related carbon-nitrogen hydrolase n=1 Tax=unclassified Synechococcus TaxID=2626047 RepID=UPI0018CC8FC2|nr:MULTISPECIES: nitrilase-related carbon-nitrogen hydrolase [unclassified Synechococcus]MEA5424513.1 nitrilase-related carbon-nitrogen hydrolase [Synechococcus sp. CCY9202]QPN65783.1 apolipoprotein N-acyltransferase [Synechococcus sp. CBW1006]CAK6697429.1 Apolipoprotein N-acyltransferase [Synechococcus sp. CBW1107]